MERCRFWPACVNGAACEYHHPTLHCKTFPHCKFGDKCLYIHPNCRFDSKCARPDCPFTHSSRRSIPPSPPTIPAAPTAVFPPKAAYRPPAAVYPPKAAYHSPAAVYPPKPSSTVWTPSLAAAKVRPPAPAVANPHSTNPPTCRFFPACNNVNCTFFHPKPCRFGLSCKVKDKGCPFFHPTLPSRQQLSWAANKAPPTSLSAN